MMRFLMTMGGMLAGLAVGAIVGWYVMLPNAEMPVALMSPVVGASVGGSVLLEDRRHARRVIFGTILFAVVVIAVWEATYTGTRVPH